ncbi:hypothetical protein [Natronorubrum sp. FCH18a]|uniref:hypothetical protein n=1 Tax=Natronorubrum sp. FCH18a TaxID=3447018 RepID=UPI003F516395
MADVDEADEYLLDRLAEYDERRRNEDEREIERSLRELRNGWADVEGEAEAAKEYDPELERVREMARERKEEFHEQLRVFESRPEYFVEEYYWDPDDRVGESLEDDE